MQDNFPPEFNPSTSYIVFATKIEYKGFEFINNGTEIFINTTVEGRLEAFSNSEELLFSFPVGEVYEKYNTSNRYDTIYRIVNNYYD